MIQKYSMEMVHPIRGDSFPAMVTGLGRDFVKWEDMKEVLEKILEFTLIGDDYSKQKLQDIRTTCKEALKEGE